MSQSVAGAGVELPRNFNERASLSMARELRAWGFMDSLA